MNLSDSRQEPAPGYLFPLAVCAPVGLPGSSTDLSTRAAPSHPEQPGDCLYPLLHRRFQASSSSADWPLLSCVTRPIWVRFHNCGSRVHLARLRQQNYSRPRLLGYLSNGQLTRYPPFRILDRPGLSWRSQGHEGFGLMIFLNFLTSCSSPACCLADRCLRGKMFFQLWLRHSCAGSLW